jgi:hypothetical protein
VRCTTFLFITQCTLVEKFWEKHSPAGAHRNGFKAERARALRRVACARARPRPPSAFEPRAASRGNASRGSLFSQARARTEASRSHPATYRAPPRRPPTRIEPPVHPLLWSGRDAYKRGAKSSRTRSRPRSARRHWHGRAELHPALPSVASQPPWAFPRPHRSFPCRALPSSALASLEFPAVAAAAAGRRRAPSPAIEPPHPTDEIELGWALDPSPHLSVF